MDTTHITIGSLWEKAKDSFVPVRVESIDGDQVHVVDHHPDHPHLHGKYPRTIRATKFRASVMNEQRNKPWRSGYIPFIPKDRR